MVLLVTLLKDTFRKFQLQAEIVMLDRDATKRQKAFGVELYDLIATQKVQMRRAIDQENSKSDGTSKVNAKEVEQVLKIFQTIENEIREPLEACIKDVEQMESSVPPFPPILVQRRKEEFGVAVWPIVSQPQWLHESLGKELADTIIQKEQAEEKLELGNLVEAAVKGVVKGTKSTITKAIGKLSPEQREVESCVETAKKDVAVYEDQKLEKLSEIEKLVVGGTTLECCG